MSPTKYAELLQFIKENNSWGADMYDICQVRNRRAIKYVDASFDSRDGSIWRITFRQIVGHKDIVFLMDTPEDVDKVYQFLNEPMSDEV